LIGFYTSRRLDSSWLGKRDLGAGQAELSRYATELRTATVGLGTFTVRHERFEVAPERTAAGV